MAEEPKPEPDSSLPTWLARSEQGYRVLGWLPGLIFAAMTRTAANAWLALAVGLVGACLMGHWLIERAEVTRGHQLMRARYVEAFALFVLAPILAIIGLLLWAGNGSPF